ncbi:Transposase [Shigella dysenteriae 1617]|uniref:Transposase n=2 Tax=Shigella dysenteriae 1617 TaxID=754093 RepID=A0A0A6ZNB5_SHIDY|nr:Transposase [Shigella dysenteriae 1617]
MAVTAAKSVMAFRVLTMAVDLCRLTTRTMNVNAGHERTSKARIIHQIQLIRGITPNINCRLTTRTMKLTLAMKEPQSPHYYIRFN